VRYLRLDDSIGADGAQHIADALKVNTSLTTLILSFNRICSAKHLADALRVNATLTRLDLRHNALTGSSKGLIRKAWRHGPGLQL
jgi:hypothetical protein